MLLEFIGEMLTLIGGLIVAYFVYVLIIKKDDAPSEDSPTMAHTALREIVERAVEEAKKLPSLAGSPSETGRLPERKDIAENSYEDLLATAILNKVIEKFQKEQVDGNSNVLHGKPVSASKSALSESEPGFDDSVEEGCSSLEPLSQEECNSVCSASCRRHLRNQPESLSLTIEEQIEEVTTTYASDEDPRDNDALAIRNAHRVPFPELGMDIIDPSQESSEDSQDEPDTPTPHIGLVSPIESWEENWLFQKKRVQTQADSVAMLVPNPSADFKALIGDKDAEDTSDLSECSSAQSDEEIEKELMEAISNVVPRSPKEGEFENDMKNCFEAHHVTSMKQNHVEGVSNGICMINQETEDMEKTVPSIQEKENEETKKKDYKTCTEAQEEDREQKIGTEVEEAKEIENSTIHIFRKESTEKSEKVEVEQEKPVSVARSVINEDSMKIEAEEQINDTGFEEDTENVAHDSTNVHRLEQVKPAEVEPDSSNSSDAIESPLVPSLAENVSNVPKTPTSTPTRISVTDCIESENDADMNTLKEQRVLNSLECAKIKLMAVNEESIDVDSSKEEVESIQQKNDFHAEDIQQESEYTEHYDIAIQRHLDSLTKTDVSVLENGIMNGDKTGESKCREAVALAKAESAFQQSLRNGKSEEEVQLATPPRPGTIAEREHKKWENAPPIENNPYSEENIQKRLWERQYSRRSSDIPGIHTELPKSNGADLEVVLTPQEPDIKRFGRDYYINNSRGSSNEKGRRSAASTCSRPSSSLSQRSSSTGADQEQQEETQYKETEFLLNRSNDVKSKVARWQRNNNLDTKYQSPARSRESSIDLERGRNENQKAWEEQRMEEILENERKNSKNEINAKLNRQENYDTIETKKANSNDSQRKIKRIDLKAYGFENEFFLNTNSAKTSTPRVVNKLDLKSFGYDGGIRRTQSNIHLNSIVNDNEFKPRNLRVTNKSNLRRNHDYEEDHKTIETRASGDNNLTQSTEALNKFEDETYNSFGLKSAKSVPNIARCYSNASSNLEDDEIESNSQSSYGELGVIKNGSVRNIANNYSIEKCNIRSSDSSVDESGNETDISFEREQPMVNGDKRASNDSGLDQVLPMPSVRRLAEAFSKQPEPAAAPVSKVTKSSNVNKERSSTPEIQIVETPRQMHSLTARSLSKQFREGLRQIPNKVASPPASHVAMEQGKIPENPAEIVQAKIEDDTNVILPGKLKSNIIFWEQMQKKS
ncbi:uncharacterized protein LOC143179959 [Calliopsis andreniformis]|uniref:uncharacterized protein LOC143179959 n=1 Tax=Calliopsis andreniformis TaxID=337506 RepID=UPI003FCEBD5F